MKYKMVAAWVFLILLFGSSATAFAEGNQPIDSIKTTVERIIEVVTDKSFQGEKNFVKRRETILLLVDQRFNFELMSRLALGESWSQRTDAERSNFVKLFSELLRKTYVRRIESYSNETVAFTKEDIKKDLAVVYSQFVKDSTKISIIYKLKKDASDWLVYDVVIEGASVIKQYRRQFSRIILEEQFEGLILRLEEKVQSSAATS